MSTSRPGNGNGPGRRARLPKPEVAAVFSKPGEDPDDRLRKVVAILLARASEAGQVHPEE